MKGGDRMKRLISCILAIVMILGLNTVCFAEAESVVSFDKITGKLTVEDSNLQTVNIGDIVTMIILKPDCSFEDLESGKITLSGSAYAIKQTEIVKEYNKLSYSFGDWKIPDSADVGTYSVRVGINSSYVKEGSFYFITLNILKKRIADIDAAPAEGMEKVLRDNKDIFDFDMTEYDALSSKTYVNDKMSNEDFSLAENATNEELDVVVKKIKDKLKEHVAVGKLDNAKADENIEQLLKDNADIYNVDLSEDSAYGKLTETLQKRVLERISEESFEDTANVEEKFNSHCVLVKFENASYGEVEKIIKDDVLKLDLTEYDELSEDEKTYVHKKMVESSPVYKTAEEVKTAFDKAVGEAPEEVNKEEKNPSKDKGSSSSGSGGGKTISLPNNMTNDNINKEETSASKVYFNDIKSVSWAEVAVNSLYEKGIVSGKADGVFAPNDNVKRAEFIKMLTEALLTVDENAQSSFVDVDSDAWYYKYIATCENAGLVAGYEDGSLKPEAAISRQEMAVMVKRFLNHRGITLNSGNAELFADNSQIADYAKEAAGELLASGIMSGDENKNFMPTLSTTRAQAAKVIFEALKLCK